MKRVVIGVAALAAAVAVIGSSGAALQGSAPTPRTPHGWQVSQPVLVRYWASHPSKAPEQVEEELAKFSSRSGGKGRTSPTVSAGLKTAVPPAGLVDFSAIQGTGYPQAGTALAECTGPSHQYLVGSANNFAGDFGSTNQNVSDFSFSSDGGATFAKGGRFGNVTFADSTKVPTNGDPAVAAPADPQSSDGACLFWVAGQALSPDLTHSGIFVARTSAATLNGACSTADACFPTKKLVVQSVDPSASTLHDSLDMAVGENPATPGARSVAVVDTLLTGTGSSIELVLCTGVVSSCATTTVEGEIPSSSGDSEDAPSVTWTNTGAIAVTWAYEDFGAGDAAGQDSLTVEIRSRTCTPTGATSVSCGATHVVTRETMPLSHATASLKDATWNVGTLPQLNRLSNRLFVVWAACGDGTSTGNDAYGICADSRIRFSYSGDGGTTWSAPGIVASGPGHQFQPSKPQEAGAKVVVGYVSTEDALALTGRNIGNDEHLASAVSGVSAPTFTNVRITPTSNWPAADWWQLAQDSIGDYQGVAANGSQVWLNFTDNYLDECIGMDIYACSIAPAAQQDAFVARYTLP